MKILLACLFLAASVTTYAQDRSQGGFSDTFTFDKNGQITSWDGVGPGGGSVSLVGYSAGIDVPFELGYLNNGFLEPCNALTIGPQVWTKGTGANVGDTFTQHGVTTCPYFTGEWGTYDNSVNRLDGFSVDANYIVALGPRTCPRFHQCYYPHIIILTGGTGIVTDTIINQ